eukprot:CAMPEP_0201713680 /NCGR_PEP_ID=MMETSP0593-20130828/430_1 /ASSEMBLY_ACC=CAM_ASM_000672 /TAXON_ID=267983 /ORGANISM="Skeletonema japonicum, Strain CCMP2506" /LENGTH=508 /DNA_ID=CAMNT_0048202857 /DNA_START=84 /DNA_END=1610 /DNA_ORIENTATION=-
MSAVDDTAMADVPPPLPPVVLPPPMMDDATAAADFGTAIEVTTVADTNNNVAATTNAEEPIQQHQQEEEEEEPSSDNTGLVNLEGIMTELLSWQSENNGSLAIPSSHPTLVRIMDSITNTTLEALTAKRWEDQLLALTAYKQRYGTCAVPPNHPTLGAWTAEQRNQYRAYEQHLPNCLTQERYEKLKNVGITVNRWEKRLVELKAFRAEHGHCDVPIDHPSGLGIWVSTQREHAHWNRDEMPKERIESLDAVGFNWNRWGHSRTKNRQDAWEAQFVKLTEFIRVEGHSNISQHDKEHGKLGKWVKNQRYEYRKFMNKGLGPSRLGRDRIEKLESIGFQWRLRPEIIPWETRFEHLKEYKRLNGDCRVPLDNAELGKWAKYQRDQFSAFQKGRPCKFTTKKYALLQSIGFEESIDEHVDNVVGETTAVAVSEEQRKKRAAAAGKQDESQFAGGGMVAQPNLFLGHAGQQQQQQYAEHHFYAGGQGTGGQSYDAYVQHPSFQQGYGGTSY